MSTLKKVRKIMPNGQSKKTQSPLVWIDMEMTGLHPETDQILEIATIITDSSLNIIAEGPELIVQQPQELFQKMDKWNQDHHTKSGLWQKVLESRISVQEAQEQTLSFLKNHLKAGESPLCGNSVWQDRSFLKVHMAELHSFFHYRIVDVSSIKELVKRWYSEKFVYKKQNVHRALEDIKESISELKFYKENLFINM